MLHSRPTISFVREQESRTCTLAAPPGKANKIPIIVATKQHFQAQLLARCKTIFRSIVAWPRDCNCQQPLSCHCWKQNKASLHVKRRKYSSSTQKSQASHKLVQAFRPYRLFLVFLILSTMPWPKHFQALPDIFQVICIRTTSYGSRIIRLLFPWPYK